ncbi:MAG: glycosyltransferase family 4 protein [Candidatus Thorarchaeota archaeon]
MPRQKSIIMVVERFWPAIGGVEKHVFRLAQELTGRSWSVRVITGAHEEGLADTERVEGIEIHRIPYTHARSPPRAMLWIIRNRHLWKGADIIHIHDTVPLLFWCLPILAVRGKRSTAVTFHGYEHDPVPLRFLFLRRVARRLMGKRTLCVGRFIERCYGIECGQITLGAVEIPASPSNNRQGLVYVGRIERDTGIMEYIEALRILREGHGLNLHMEVIGDGSLKPQVEQVARERGLPVKFHGAMHEPWSIAGSAKVCLAVGFLSILEAMSLGIPVVSLATSPLRISYLRSVNDAGGPISIQTTAEGVAREIARLESDPHLYQKISNTGKIFAGRHTWTALTEEYLRLWRSLS